MTEPTTPSWYDLLDVAPDASEGEIRAAWKAAIADLDPTDRRFRVRNQAAEVLLDKKRRAAYDAELAAAQHERESHDEAQQADAQEADAQESEEPRAPAAGPVTPTALGAPAASGPASGPASGSATGPARRVVPAWLLAGVAVLTAVAVGAAAWVWFALPSDASVEESTRAAQSAAERAVGPILSYDYRHLDEDQAAAESYMTSGYRQDYDKLFAVVKQNAPSSQTVVTGKVISSGIVRSGTDRVEVLLFVDQSTTNKQNKSPVVYKNQVRAQMEQVGGDWLVDCLITTPNGSCG